MSRIARARTWLGKAIPPALAQRATAGAARPSALTPAMNPIDAINAATGGQTPREGIFSMLPLPRDPRDLVPFGPLHGVPPAPIDPARPDGSGRPEPRLDEYDVGANLPGAIGDHLPWRILRDASMQVDVMRRCIELRKRHIRGLTWAWTVSESAVEVAMQQHPRGTASRSDVEFELRQRLQPEIGRLTEFWQRPWKANGLNWGQWINLVVDEHLTLDAVALYPRMTYGRQVTDLEVISGDTIKLLRDNRGARPLPPFPAYQQEIFGFPRGEFTATVEQGADGVRVPNAYFGDQLYYYRSNPRPKGSPYGYPPVEQALISARLYLRRQGWMLSEYDDGVLPRAWLVPDANGEQLTLLQRREWQQDLNDELAGNTAVRQRVTVTPKGFKPLVSPTLESQYRPEYDLYLIKLIAGHFDVMSTELGFSEPGGLGSAGFHEGNEDIQYRIGTRPTVQVLQELIVDVSQRFLGAPPELTFKFLGLESEDEAAQDQVAQNRVQSARMTLNEDRDRQGLPRYPFPEADMPMVTTARGVVFLEGAAAQVPPGELIEPAQAQPGAGGPEPGSAPGDTVNPPVAVGPAQTAPAPAKNGKKKNKTAELPKRAPQILTGDDAAHAVFDQLLEDYPRSALGWVMHTDWRGPIEVPLHQVDFTHADTWAAAHEPGKVARFERKIRHGKRKPVILVRTPHGEKDIVVDGHHRSTAYRNLNQPVLAWVGHVHHDTGPWNTLHTQQYVNPSGPDTDTAAAAPMDKAAIDQDGWAEAAAYQRWLAKGGRARQFRFEHLSAAQALTAGIVPLEDIGVTATFAGKADPGPKARAGAGPATASISKPHSTGPGR